MGEKVTDKDEALDSTFLAMIKGFTIGSLIMTQNMHEFAEVMKTVGNTVEELATVLEKAVEDYPSLEEEDDDESD